MDGSFVSRPLILAAVCAVGLFSNIARADEPFDGQEIGYDSIVNELNREVDRPATVKARRQSRSEDSLDTIWFHAGVGVVTLMEQINFEDGSNTYLGQKGIQVAGGIDLFSPNLIAEGTLRNFGESDDATAHASLKEFELKVYYHDRLSPQLGFHLGGGLSARYMTIRRLHGNVAEYTTPTSVGGGSLDFFLGERISVGVEASARSALISETVDRGSFDATLRLDIQL